MSNHAPIKTKSELELLLEKNAYGPGLSEEEKLRATIIIGIPEFADKPCWVCPKDDADPAIYDTGLCQSHAYYALMTRK